MGKPGPAERRVRSRWPTRLSGLVLAGDQHIEVRVLDLSMTGCLLRGVDAPVGSAAVLRTVNHDDLIHLKTQVVRRARPHGTIGVAVILPLTPEAESHLPGHLRGLRWQTRQAIAVAGGPALGPKDKI